MLTARLHAPGEQLRLGTVPLPQPAASEVRVRVAACGVCHTDLHIARGEVSRVELPLTLGHEIAGWIDAAGPDAGPLLAAAGLRPGDPVLVFGGWGCGSCAECLTGEEQRCATGRSPGFQVDGGYAQAVLVPHPRHLVPIGGLDPVRAAPLADAGVTPYRAVRRAAPWLHSGARVLVIGAGGLGQFAVQYLRMRPGLRIVVAEPDVDRRAAASELGADATLAHADRSSALAALAGEANAVFDLVGSDTTLGQAAEIVAPNGLVMLVGESGGTLAVGFRSQLESWVTTTAWGSVSDLRSVVALAARGALRWTVETVPLSQAQAALDRLAGGLVAGRLVVVPPRAD